MKELIALSFLVCFAIVTIFLTASKRIDFKTTVAFLLFCLGGAFLIPNHDIIKRVRYDVFEVETFERQVTQIKQNALDEVRRDVANQKKSLSLLAETAIKIAYVLADGSGRLGGMPESHMKQIKVYQASMKDFLSPNLDKEIDQTMRRLEREIEKLRK
jgi:hypothetical protein